MKKTTLLLTLIVLNTFIYSCASDENGGTTEPTENRLVKSVKVNDNFKSDYTYNSQNLLTNWIGTQQNFGYEMELVYDSNKNLIENHYQETGSGTYSSDTYFTYNTDGKLISYDAVALTYSGNTITATGTIEGNQEATIVMETNINGLITKLTEMDNYTIFEYSANGNLTTAKNYNNSNILLTTYNVSYDQKINPFFGQFKSTYVERFIEFFYPFEGIYVSGYDFPFFKNNITSISKNAIETTAYNYSYDNQNHPTEVNRTSSGESFSYTIEYHEP